MKDDNEYLASFGAEDKKLTDWKKEPKLSDLKTMFEDSKNDHSDKLGKINNWNDLLDAKGKHKPVKVKGRSSVQPKLIRKQAEWRYSALTEPFLGSDKLFQVEPTTFEDEDAAIQNELLLNWQFRTKLNKVKFIDDYVRSVVDEGTVICRVAWVRETTKTTEEFPEYGYYALEGGQEEIEAYAAELKELAELSQQNPREYSETIPEEIQEAVNYFMETGMPVEVVIERMVEEEVDKIVDNKPTVEVLDPNDVYIDPTCKGDMDNALFVVYAFETSKFQLLKEKDRYKNIDKVNWGDLGIDSDRDVKTIGQFKFKDTVKAKVTAYEYWGYHDINDDGVMVPIVATWIGDTLVRMEESPFPDGKLPFVVVPYLPIKRQLYGETDAELLEDNQAIAGAVTRGMIDLLGRSANAQTGIPKGFLDLVNKRKFEGGEDYEYNPQQHPGNSVHTHKMPEIPNSAMNMLGLQNQEAESYTGIKSFSGGISGSAYGDVAAGIRGALDASAKREMAILRRLARGMTEIGNKIIAMNSEFLSEKEVVRVTNKQYIEVLREDLKGNFDLIVDISTAEVDDNKSQDLAFMAQTIGPIAGPQASITILSEIADLKRMPGLAQRLREMNFEPSEEDQMLKQLEIQKAQLEIAELESRINMNNAIAEEKSGKAYKTVIDAEEQSSGITHRREMAKQKAQSQGNQNLAITKALASARKPDQLDPNIEAAIGHAKLTELSSKYTEEDLKDNQHSARPVNNNEFM